MKPKFRYTLVNKLSSITGFSTSFILLESYKENKYSGLYLEKQYINLKHSPHPFWECLCEALSLSTPPLSKSSAMFLLYPAKI